MDVSSQLAMNCRTRILEFPRKLVSWSNRGRAENHALKNQYRSDLLFFVQYWHNHPDAGFWFDAPFMAREEVATTEIEVPLPAIELDDDFCYDGLID